MANKIYDVVDNDESIKKFADKLAKESVDEQRVAIDDLCDQSTVLAIKVSIQLIKNIKDVNDKVIKNNKSFLDLCDKGIESLQEIIKDENVSESEKSKAREDIMTILKMANDLNTNTNKQIIRGAIIGGFAGAFVALGLIVTNMSKHMK